MKKIVNSLLMLLVLATVIVSCKNVEKQIIGKWQVSSVDVQGIDKFVQQMAIQMGMDEKQIDTYIEQMKTQIEENYKSSYNEQIFEFTPDYKLSIYTDATSENKIINNWKYNKEANSIDITSDNGEGFQFIINKIDSQTLEAEIKNLNKDEEIKTLLIFKKI